MTTHLPPIAGHPQYDPKSLRVLCRADQIERLPVREITVEEDYELRCDWYWNGLEYYPPTVSVLPGEVGYDRKARYMVVL